MKGVNELEIYRTRHRAIMKVLIEQYGVSEAYDMYYWTLRNPIKCTICQSAVHSYSEWHETGYEHERCSNGCWDHTIYGMDSDLETKGFHFRGKLTERILLDFENQVKKNAAESKRNRQLFYRKKKSQRKRL